MNSSENKSMPWTGERYVPEVGGQVELEHVHRYAFASQFIGGLEVLDIACGEGYGSAFLAREAKYVTGVDISEEVVRHASLKYDGDNLKFLHGSCAAIPLPDASVDVVVSFETIEHHAEHELMMQEISRVLRPNGILLISCPEKHEYTDVPGSHNQYHVKELYRHEFEALIAESFRHVGIFGQRIAYGSAIFSESVAGATSSFNIDQPDQAHSKGISRPHYLLALASNGPLPTAFSSFCEQSITETEYALGWSALVAKLNQERDTQIAELNGAIQEMRRSVFWRITYPFRAMKKAIGRGVK